jgi:hypothetical protein
MAAQGKDMMIVYDKDLEQMPENVDVRVVGYENRFCGGIRIHSLYRDVLSQEEQSAIRDLYLNQSLVYAIPHPDSPGNTIGFIGTHSPETILTLARKLMHYGSYGYLGFTGPEFTNVLKGSFPVMNSALDHVILYEDHPPINQTSGSRRALAYPAAE